MRNTLKPSPDMTRPSQTAPLPATDANAAIAKSRAAVRSARAESGNPAKSRYTVQSLVVGLRVLEALAKGGEPRGVTELARALGTTKWVIFRHLHTLCGQKFVIQDAVTEKYEIGPRFYALKEMVPDRFAWAHKARGEMLRLRQEAEFTVAIAGPLEDDSGVVIIDVKGGMQNVQFMLKVGAVFDYHASAHGKLALAFGDPRLLERVIAQGLPRRARKTITAPDALRREITKVRKRGWAMAPEEADPGMNALTAPFFSSQGKFEGSIGIFGSLDQISDNPPPALVRAVVQAAQRISRRLGNTTLHVADRRIQ